MCQPTVSYRYGDTIQRKILTICNKIIQSDKVTENISCDCEKVALDMEFINMSLYTRGQNFIEGKDLRRLLGKGLNFKLPKQRNSEKLI